MNKDFDVIVVGGGGAGLAAAIIAKKAGASCMVLEADKKLGGHTSDKTARSPMSPAGFGHFIEAYMAPWAIMVNKRGRRFVAEYSPYAVFGYTINERPEQRAWAIFDEPTLREGGNDLTFADPYNSGGVVTSWEEATIRKQIKAGRIAASNSLAELAEKVGIDGLAFAATVERSNEDCAYGKDREFFKKAPKLFPIEQAPFYAIEVRGGVIGPTSTGVEIDHYAAVLDLHGRPIRGLYAAGEAAGGTLGRRYPGGGISISNAVVFGRVAGDSAAKAAANSG